MLSVVDSLKHVLLYVLGRRFLVRTNNSALNCLRNFLKRVKQMAR